MLNPSLNGIIGSLQQPFASQPSLFSSAVGFREQLLLWARLRFGLGAAAEFTMCEPQSVEHLAGDMSVALIFVPISLC